VESLARSSIILSAAIAVHPALGQSQPSTLVQDCSTCLVPVTAIGRAVDEPGLQRVALHALVRR
jgi:hypothetical protein